MSELWPALLLSLRIAAAATGLAFVVAVPLAYWVARRDFPGKTLLEAVITVPLILPPTVVGYLLLIALGRSGWLGEWFGYSIAFRFEGAVLASALVALPMLYMPAKAAFAGIDRDLVDTAVVMGATRLQLFRHVSLPLARRGIAAGLLLAFARALGEFGATVMVFGQIEGRLTLPVLIYSEYAAGESVLAVPAVLLLSGMSLGVIWAYNRALRE
jgi:molybdate transport system permease protein